MFDYIKNKGTGAISRVSTVMTGFYLGLGTFVQATKYDYEKQQNGIKEDKEKPSNTDEVFHEDKPKFTKK